MVQECSLDKQYSMVSLGSEDADTIFILLEWWFPTDGKLSTQTPHQATKQVPCNDLWGKSITLEVYIAT